MDKSIPFPQANDFEKIINLINLEKDDLLNDEKYISCNLQNISDRQVSYYLSACMYLGLISRDKHFTELGYRLRKISLFKQRIELIRIIISDEIIGTVYLTQKAYGIELTSDEAIEIIKEYYPNYSDALYFRRYQTVKSWIDWIEKSLY